jgi:uncharacterized peroxidase-related enzyme
MAYVTTIEPETATGELAHLYAEISSQRHHVSNVFQLQSLDPMALRANFALYMSSMFGGGGLSQVEREAIAVAVSSANECTYCLHHHSNSLLRAGGSEELLDALQVGAEPDLEGHRLQRLIYFARKLTLLPGSMSRRDNDDLRAVGFTDLDILQAAQITAYYNYINRLANGLGVELEPEN